MNCKYHSDRDAVGKCKACGADLCAECDDFAKQNDICPSCAKMYVYRTYDGSKNGLTYNIVSLVCAVAFLALYIVSICLNKLSTNLIVMGAVIIGLLLPLSIFMLVYNITNMKKCKLLMIKTNFNNKK